LYVQTTPLTKLKTAEELLELGDPLSASTRPGAPPKEARERTNTTATARYDFKVTLLGTSEFPLLNV